MMNQSPESAGDPTPFYLPQPLWHEMLAHTRACLPEEACGLVGGQPLDPAHPQNPSPSQPGFRPMVFLPVENELHSPVRFRMAPAAQLKAFYWLEEHGLELSAIYHSHPQGPRHPSQTDLAEFAYPGVLMLLACPHSPPAGERGAWHIRAYRINDGMSAGLSASEVPLLLVPHRPIMPRHDLDSNRDAV